MRIWQQAGIWQADWPRLDASQKLKSQHLVSWLFQPPALSLAGTQTQHALSDRRRWQAGERTLQEFRSRGWARQSCCLQGRGCRGVACATLAGCLKHHIIDQRGGPAGKKSTRTAAPAPAPGAWRRSHASRAHGAGSITWQRSLLKLKHKCVVAPVRRLQHKLRLCMLSARPGRPQDSGTEPCQPQA